PACSCLDFSRLRTPWTDVAVAQSACRTYATLLMLRPQAADAAVVHLTTWPHAVSYGHRRVLRIIEFELHSRADRQSRRCARSCNAPDAEQPRACRRTSQ